MRGGIAFTFGVLILFTGYGMLYFGVKNLLAGQQTITLREALGLPGSGTTATGGAINNGPTKNLQQTVQDWTGGQ